MSWIPGTAVRGAKREAEPLVSDLRFRKERLSALCYAKIIFVFLLVTSPCCYEAMIPVDQRLATSPLLLLWMWFTMTSPRRHSLCCCNGTLNYLRTGTKKKKKVGEKEGPRKCETALRTHPKRLYCAERKDINRHRCSLPAPVFTHPRCCLSSRCTIHLSDEGYSK